MQARDSTPEPEPTFTDFMRHRFRIILEPMAEGLNRLRIAPNTVTLAGLLGNFIGAVFLAQGEFLVGGLIVLIMGPVDALDGTMARLRGERSDFGAFVDSVTDRYSELIILGGLLAFYSAQAEGLMIGLIFAAAAGSVLVSYVRARAEALGFTSKVGILTRMERYFVLAPSLVLGFPRVGIAIVAVLANLTALQRILGVRQQAHRNLRSE